ncbi:bifunctional 2-polyprenyl-6-hydroxyphenol methylase/3-demethylubiquinol 3-O-methyltransferase UbiG [Desulforhabdus sp. TSK]|uniref:class I SAM-dependent methyltransferase n=1 Tax=Desulforhabdus sp. TSK TaxID=2925014 RepID=UPI001FC7C75A|nr:class I SAM-dependent methyltransferase [Desulforhabdus sp. TSK]GKT08225.1 hypothetical protein DSTSK_15300 [Desulforhabdus sp. TSK]
MNIEEYANKHFQYWYSQVENLELKLLFENNKFKNIIDIGCGDGSILYACSQSGYLNKCNEIWAIDLSWQRLSQVYNISNFIKCVQDDAQELRKIPEEYFDFVICTQVIEHVENDLSLLKAIYRISKTGTIIYLDTIFKKRFGWYFYINEKGKRTLDPTHEREYENDNELFSIICNAGLKIIYSKKQIVTFSIMNYIIRLLNIKNRLIFQNKFLQILQKIKLPIPGYYIWKLILAK